jgi:hypothetical protein
MLHMRHGIVEGEPGIFPDPIARFYRWLSQVMRRRRRDEANGSNARHKAPDPGSTGEEKPST